MSQITEHLKVLVDMYPATNKQENVLKLLEYCKKQLAASGSFSDAHIFEHNGVSSLFGSTKSTKMPKILLQGHIDVVPAPEVMQKFVETNDKLEGRGVFDMLFAAASYLALVHEIKAELPGLDFGIFLSGDEEVGGFNSVLPFLDKGYSTELIILPDAGLGFGDLNIASKGVFTVEIIVNGTAHHGSRPWEGDGAAGKLAHLLVELEKAFDMTDHQNSTMTVSKLKAGDAINKGPAQAMAHVDIRFSDTKSLEQIKEHLHKLLEKYGAKLGVVFEESDFQLNTKNEYVQNFLTMYKSHNEGAEISLSKSHGSSDARYFAEKNIPVVMLRPKGGGAHGDTEYIDKAEIDKFYALIKAFVLETAKIEEI